MVEYLGVLFCFLAEENWKERNNEKEKKDRDRTGRVVVGSKLLSGLGHVLLVVIELGLNTNTRRKREKKKSKKVVSVSLIFHSFSFGGVLVRSENKPLRR